MAIRVIVIYKGTRVIKFYIRKCFDIIVLLIMFRF